ncbi:DMT family transporter [Dyella ginsengisoli]|uniref:DMT family transporter n=1 Tax=Dyella ginsengisoli TaxID=363848 RepID=A0ABW8JYM0_9GAMM
MTRATPGHASVDAGFYATLLGATFLMGSSFIAGKILLGLGVPAILLVGWRFLLAAIATLPLLAMARVPLRAQLWPPAMAPRQAWVVGAIGLLQTAAVMGLLFVGMRSIPAAAAAILLFSNPIWVALLGRLFLHESLGPMRVAGLILGMLGVALAIGPGALLTGQREALFGELCCLASAVCWAVATTINKRAALPIGGLALNFWQMLIGALVLLALAYTGGERWPADVGARAWLWFAWLAVPASTGSFGLWFVALRRGGATHASGWLFLAPLFAVLLSFAVLHTTLSPLQLFGGVLIGVGLWLVNRVRG